MIQVRLLYQKVYGNKNGNKKAGIKLEPEVEITITENKSEVSEIIIAFSHQQGMVILKDTYCQYMTALHFLVTNATIKQHNMEV